MSRVLLATGGTIAWHGAEQRMMSGAELASACGASFDRVADIAAKPSWDLTVKDMESVARAVCAAIDDGASSVVVTHGTDALEETAWLTELLLGARRRAQSAITFTGAMRFADDAHADGPENLRLAAESGIVAAGVRVAFAGRLMGARSVRKVDTVATDAFSGETDGRPPPDPGATLQRDVVLLKVGPVATPPIPSGAAGVVVEGTGAAHVPSGYHEQLRNLGIPIVLATRVPSGHRARDLGPFLSAGDLSAEKAALALMVAIGTGHVARWWKALG